MPLTQYNLSSKSYKNTVFTGFSRLQKEEGFVDLTLAADGCFSKVHRSVIALASPYLGDILRNLQGNAPVIYLNKIRKEILEFILEYIYQGDVNIPVHLLEEFIEVSKSLHIVGIADLEPIMVSPEPLESTAKNAKKRKCERVPNIEVSKPTDCTNLPSNDNNDDDFELQNLNTNHDQESNKVVIVKNNNKDLITFHSRKEQWNNPSIDMEIEQRLEIPIETTPDLLVEQSCKAPSYNIILKPAKEQTETTENIPLIEIQACPNEQDNITIIGIPNDLAMLANTSPDHNNVEKSAPVINILSNNESMETDVGDLSYKANLNDMKNMAQYSITERGALHLILNRFIYCSHGTSNKKQRWRCIEYRRGACPAIVDTDADGVIVYRKGIHGHEFHDKKIYQKHINGLIYSTKTLALAKHSKEKDRTKIVSIDEIDDDDDDDGNI